MPRLNYKAAPARAGKMDVSCHRDFDPPGNFVRGPISPEKCARYNGPHWGLWSGIRLTVSLRGLL